MQDFARWQAGLYLEPIHKYLWIKQEAVSDMLEAGHQHLDRLLEIIGSYEVVPSDMVCSKTLSNAAEIFEKNCF